MDKLWLTAALAALALATSGCASDDGAKPDLMSGVSQSVKDRLALCSAGARSSVGVDVEAKVGKTLQEGGKLSAALKQEIEGAILRKVDTKDAPAVYQTYVGCIEKPLS